MMKAFPYVCIALVITSFSAGWKTASWSRDSVELSIQKAAYTAGENAREKTQHIASASGERLEQQLDELRHAQPREIHREIIKPVFTNVCLSPEFVQLYNDSAATVERTLSGQSVKKMP